MSSKHRSEGSGLLPAESAWNHVVDQLADAHAALIAGAFAEAHELGIPQDGSWRFRVWSETEEVGGRHLFKLLGRWEEVER